MSIEREKALNELRAKAIADARTIVDEAEKSGQPVLEGEKEEQYQRAIADMDRYSAAVEEERKLTAAEDVAKQAAERYADAAPPEQREVDSWRANLWNALQTRDAWHTELPAPSCVVPDGTVADMRGNPIPLYAINREQRTEYPYILSGATTNANYAVPAIVSDQIEQLSVKYSGVLQCQPHEFVTEGINTLYIPNVATMLVAVQGAENTADSNSAYGVLGRATLTGYRTGGYSVISEEDIASSAPDMLAFVEQQLVNGIANLKAKNLVIGTNSTTPAGALTAAVLATGVTAASKTTFTFDEVIGTFNALSCEYWANAKWLFSQSAFGIALKLKDDDGDYLVLPDVRGNVPNTILGKPVFIDAQGTTVATGVPACAVGDWSHFHVRYGMGGRLFMDVSTEFYFTKWNRVIRAAIWMDSQPGIAAAFSSLVML